MKSRLVGAVALSLALSYGVALPAAYAAEPAAAQFRTAAPKAFNATELKQYGLSDAKIAEAEKLQKQGYEIRVLSEKEAQQYQAGITDNQWLMLAILAGVIVIAVAVAD